MRERIGRVFSGMQPTGVPHLGNYLGAVRHWVRLQNEINPPANITENTCAAAHSTTSPTQPPYHSSAHTSPRSRLMFCAVDLHALTSRPQAAELRGNIREMVSAIIASGIDPKRCILYQQSAVPGHTELAWVLSCVTNMGRLNRMTQFKDKAGKSLDKTCLGLYSYPVLMAADILLFQCVVVVVVIVNLMLSH